jgi:hypothetical protein
MTRAHIVHAVVHLLQHHPVQGKSALDWIRADLMRASFPRDLDTVCAFLNDKYLDRAKGSLVRNLVVVLTQTLLRADDPELLGRERQIIHTLVAISRRHPVIYGQVMEERLDRIVNGLDDRHLISVFSLLGAEPRCWRCLDEATQIHLKGYLSNLDLPSAQIVESGVFDAMVLDVLKPALLTAFAKLDPADKEKVIIQNPQPEFVQGALEIYSRAGSLRAAQALGMSVVNPMIPYFSAENIADLLAIVADNGHIRYAPGTIEVLENVFDGALHLLDDTQDAWCGFVRKMHELYGHHGEDFPFAYPSLRRRLVERGIRV